MRLSLGLSLHQNRILGGWVDPLAGVTLTGRLQTHNGNNVPMGMYLDTACTMPATEDGDIVMGWRDEVGGTGITAIQADSGKCPLLHFDNGTPYLAFDGIDDVLVSDLSIDASGIDTRGLLGMGHQYPGARIAYDTILSARPGVVAIQAPSVANTYAYNWNDDVAQYDWLGGPAITEGWRSYVLQMENLDATITLDGVDTVNTNTNTGASGSAVFNIGADPGLGRFSEVNVSSVIIAPTPDDWEVIAAYISSLLPDPAEPTGFTAVGGDEIVNLTWDDSGIDASVGLRYRIYRGLTATFSAATLLAENVDALLYDDATVTNDTEYFYWLQVYYSNGASVFVGPESATPAASGATDPLAPYTTAFRLLVHHGDNVPVNVYQDEAMTTPATADGDLVMAAHDPVSGLTASWSNSMQVPVLRFVSGVPVLEWAGGARLVCASLNLSQPVTIYSGNQAGTGATYIMDSANAGNRIAMGYSLAAADDKLGVFAGTVLDVVTSSIDPQVICAVMNGGSSSLYKDGSLLVSGGVGVNSLAGLTIGARFAGDFNFEGYISSLVIQSGVTGDTERGEIETILASLLPPP